MFDRQARLAKKEPKEKYSQVDPQWMQISIARSPSEPAEDGWMRPAGSA